MARGRRASTSASDAQNGPLEAGQIQRLVCCVKGTLPSRSSRSVRVLLDELGYVAYVDEAPPCKNEVIARLQPALAIIDINYGHEPFTWALLRAVKEDPATASIPVIACAAAPWLLEHEAVFFTHNSVCTWSEPYDPIELLRTIDVA